MHATRLKDEVEFEREVSDDWNKNIEHWQDWAQALKEDRDRVGLQIMINVLWRRETQAMLILHGANAIHPLIVAPSIEVRTVIQELQRTKETWSRIHREVSSIHASLEISMQIDEIATISGKLIRDARTKVD